MRITTSDIKALREKTQCPLSDCKKALIQSEGDIQKAIKILVANGAKEFEKRKSADANNGIVTSYIHDGGKIGSLLELKCETDFVAKTKEFKNIAHEICLQIAAMNPKDVKELLKQPYVKDETLKMEDLVTEVISKLKEKIEISRFSRFEI